MTAAICMMPFAFPYFASFGTKVPVLVIGTTVLMMVIHSALCGTQVAYIAESFRARIRYTGASLGYQGASIIAGGPSDFAVAVPDVPFWLHGSRISRSNLAGKRVCVVLPAATSRFDVGHADPPNAVAKGKLQLLHDSSIL
jgi:hypothetical protein